MSPDTAEPTPADKAAAKAVQHAHHIAMMELDGYRVLSETVFRVLVIGAVVSAALNVGLWAYVLVRLPP